ncbi:MAG: HAMP domain-containing protein [Ignavibacteriae bacterium]|nr:MAG: HAMP domain-containing protein [Ignavibacteriota bacterium]
MNFKLRNRIAFLYLTATAVLTAILFLITYAVVQNAVYSHLDEQLDTEINEVSRGLVIDSGKILLVNPYEWEEREHSQVEVNPTFIQIIDRHKEVLKKTDNLHDNNLEFIPLINEKIYINSFLSSRPIREVQLPLITSSGFVSGYLMIAVSQETAILVLNKLEQVLVIGFLGALVILFFLTRWIAEKSIIPIHKVISTTEKITKENLYERVELPVNKDEIYTLTSTINGLLERLEDAVLREKQFTADASHELRTPLSVLKGTLEVLIRKPRDIEHYEKKISYCIKEVNRMSAIIDQLLMLARYESGKLQPLTEEIELVDSVKYTVLRMQEQAKEHCINICFDEKDKYPVKADPFMIDVIIENLISNAVKYSNGNKRIDIEITKTDYAVTCSVKDYGIGIQKEHLARIFDRFFRIDEARNSEIKGHGIGLAIVKRLIDVQNLTISFTSESAKGTIAVITFPQVC